MPAADQPLAELSFGSRIQKLRRDARLTQRQLSDRVGIDFTYLSKLENSRGEAPSEQTVRKLAAELGADPEELLALSGKIPAELREKAAEDSEFALLLRKLPHLSEAELDRLYRSAGIRKKQGPKPPRP